MPLNITNGPYYPVDYYAFILSRWTQKALKNAISQLRVDIFWAVHARNLFGYYNLNSISCEKVLERSGISVFQATYSCLNYGWSINTNTTWMNLITWIKAASKYPGCQEYNIILSQTDLSNDTLDNLLYNTSSSILIDLQNIQTYLSTYYGCTRSVCGYDEMVWMQWSGAIFTSSLTKYLVEIALPSNSIYSWLPLNYAQVFEWPNFSNYPLTKEQAQGLINYDTFLSPNGVKQFFHSYFQQNYAQTVIIFNLPNISYVEEFYNYFQKVIPGSGLFYTNTWRSWVLGFIHPFWNFLSKINIYEGGNPIISPGFAVASNTSDLPSFPKTVMISGKDNVKQTRNFYLYYGSPYAIKYGATLNVFCPKAINYTTTAIWPKNHPLEGTDGGRFANGLSKDDILVAYVDAVRKNVKLVYQESQDYYNLPVLKFVVDPDDLKTSTDVPSNIHYNQYPWGMNGFYNLTQSYGFPYFMSKPHYYGCSDTANKMSYIYEYTPSDPLSKRIHPSSSDDPYILVNAETGASVKLRFKLMGNLGIYSDYYFNNISQPDKTYGLYIPYYTLQRFVDWTESQISDHFGALIEAHFLKDIFFYLGIISGAFFLQIALMIAVFIRRFRRRMHHKRLSLAIRKSVDKKRNTIDRK